MIEFPYFNMQQLNLDWIIDKIKGMLSFLPDDGAAGQILRRTADGAEWSDETVDSVESVNGKTGAVVLDADDILMSDNSTVEDTVDDLKSNLGYVTPEMFGAKGDRTTDDTTAIQDCINYAIANSINVFMPHSYKVTSTITISGMNYTTITLSGDILYTGNDWAILVTNARRSTLSVGRITAPSGSCIKFYSESNSTDYISYCLFSFKQLYAGQKCIWFEIGASAGYINENTIWGGHLANGQYGIYADAKTRGQVQFKAYNVGFEGVTTGAHLIGAQYCVFINPRYGEQASNVLVTEGSVIHLLWQAADKLKLSHLSLSNSTSGSILAPVSDSGGVVKSYKAIIYSGVVLPSDKQAGYYNAAGETLDLNVAEYLDQIPTYIQVTATTPKVRLSKIYGRRFGINEFIVLMSFDNGTPFTIEDANGVVIFSNTAATGWKWCRFCWNETSGWLLERLDRASLT